MASVIKAALPVLGLLGGALLVAGGAVLLARGGGRPAPTPQVAERTTPANGVAPAGETAGIPPLDAAAPAEVETATFALG